MLYVFLVNTGTMLTLDMALTMDSVHQLQVAIEAYHNLPKEKQVLMISGGQSLDPQMRVCSYSAGTDTNPIFLFSKETIEAAGPLTFHNISDAPEDKLQVEGLKDMPPSYSAVVARTQLALQFHDVAKEKLKRCEELVHDQHLQQQGWMAVVANLDDITSAFKQRAEQFHKNMSDFLRERPLLQDRVSQFTSILSLLEKTPLLPCLRHIESSEVQEISLLQWISNQDQKSTLNQMANQCSKAVEQFTESVLENLHKECAKCLEAVDKPSMKEIKGLGERLFGLEQLLTSAQKILTDQAEMAQGLVQNQTRVSNINDPSVLPDLCSSHQQQLDVMNKKHLQLIEICRRCQVAKEELCQNLHVRLRWIMYIEQQISVIHNKMVIYHENLKRLRKRLEIVRQVVTAPEVYSNTLVEIIRRRIYNKQYHQWSETISEQSSSIHKEEVIRRKRITDQLHHHFLSTLFPGMDEIPPTFATNQPMQYDLHLPPVKEEDILHLLQKVPELAPHLRLPQAIYYASVIELPLIEGAKEYQEIETQTSVPEADSNCNEAFHEYGGVASYPEYYSAPDQQGNLLSDWEGVVDHSDGVIVDYSDGAIVDHSDGPKEDHSDGLVHGDKDNVGPDYNLIDIEYSPREGKTPYDESGDLLRVERENTRLSLKANLDSELCLSSMMNEPFYSAVGTPIEGNIPFLSTKPEDMQTTTSELEDKIFNLTKKLEEIEMSKSVLESQSTESDKRNLEKLHQLQKMCELRQENMEGLRAKLRTFKGNFLVQIKELKGDLRDIKEETSLSQIPVISWMKENHNRVLKVCTNILESQEETHKEVLSNMETKFLKDKQDFEGKLQNSNSTIEKISRSLTESKEHMKSLEEVNITRQKSLEFIELELKDKKDSLEKLEEVEKERLVKIDNLEHEVSRWKLVLKDKDEEVAKLMKEHEEKLRQMNEEHAYEFEEFKSSLKMEYEMEVQDLEVKVCDKEAELEEAQIMKEAELAELRRKMEVEKLEAIASMRKEAEKEHKEERERMQKIMQETQLREVSELAKSKEMLLEVMLQEQKDALEEEKKQALEEMKETLRKESSEGMNLLIAEQESEIDSLKTGYDRKVKELERELAEMKSKHSLEMNKLGDSLEESVMSVSRGSEIEKEREQHQREMQELRDLLEQQNKHAIEATRREYEHKLERIRQSMNPADLKKLSSAEKQVAFNEAISRITVEKDEEIAWLKQREADLMKGKEELEESMENLLIQKGDVLSEVHVLVRSARQAEKEAKDTLAEREGQLRQLESELSSLPQASPAELLVSSMTGSLEPPDSANKLRALLQSKEQECHSLKKQLMHLRTAQGAPRGDKVCIKDIGVGDLVLVKYEEAHENYIIFTVETMCYFVHSESLHALGLKTVWPTGEEIDEHKKEWSLGRVVDKEYCQAKKAQNRFKVPLGTKFYRVKISGYEHHKPSN